MKKLADTVAPGGSNSISVDVGSPGDSKVVVVEGDFHLKGDGVTPLHGAGMLIVTGELVFNGDINYDGMILVLGEGSMRRQGGGSGTLSGGIIVANTLGPDGVPGTADDVLGSPTLDTSGGGDSNIRFCSTVIDDMIGAVPPRPIAFKHYF